MALGHVRLVPKADIRQRVEHVCSVPIQMAIHAFFGATQRSFNGPGTGGMWLMLVAFFNAVGWTRY